MAERSRLLQRTCSSDQASDGRRRKPTGILAQQCDRCFLEVAPGYRRDAADVLSKKYEVTTLTSMTAKARRPSADLLRERGSWATHVLHRVEEVLVAAALATGQGVHRSPSAPPAAVLGVRVADKVSRAA